MKTRRYRVLVYDDFQLMGTMLIEENNPNAAIHSAKARLRFKPVPWDCTCGVCSYSRRSEWCDKPTRRKTKDPFNAK